MSYLDTSSGAVVSRASGDERAGFIRRTFTHLAVAIAIFALLESYLLSIGLGEKSLILLGQSKLSWLLVMVAFMGVSVLADKWARDDYSPAIQYLSLIHI